MRGARIGAVGAIVGIVASIAVASHSLRLAMSSESFDRLWEAHFLRDVGLPHIGSLQPVVWFGILSVGSLLIGIAVNTVLARRIDHASQRGLAQALLVVNGLLVLAVAAFGLAGGLAFAVAAYWCARTLRGAGVPLFVTWLNRNIEDSSVRATVLSISEQADAVGQWTGGPAIGAVGSFVSLRGALLVGAAVLSPAVALYGRALRHGGEELELEGLPLASDA